VLGLHARVRAPNSARTADASSSPAAGGASISRVDVRAAALFNRRTPRPLDFIALPQFWKFDDFREADRIQALSELTVPQPLTDRD
jgi:hypothetical protein